jgi:Ca-activated chloride channel family protein
MTDAKNTPSLDELISDMESAPIDANAKKRAINLAMAEFNQQHSLQSEGVQQDKKKDSFENSQNKTQGFWMWARPISHFITANRKNIMAILNNKLLYSGVATLSVAVIGTLLFQQTYRPSFDPSLTVVGEELRLAEQLGVKKLAAIESGAIESGAIALESQKHQDQSLAIAGQASSKKDVEKASRQVTADDAVAASDSSASLIASGDTSLSEQNVVQSSVPSPKPSTNADELTAVINQVHPAAQQPFAMAERKRNAGAAMIASGSVVMGKNKSARSESLIQMPGVIPLQAFQEQGRDKFESLDVNAIKLSSEEPVSTFSIDVDTASYSFVRRQLNQGVLPQKDAVRIEEMVNYFDYAYPLAQSTSQPFKPSISVQPSPWNQGKKLITIGVKGYDIKPDQQPRSNLVLLLDVSGSMNSHDKLPLVKKSMSMLLDTLHPEDTIAIAVYAGAAGQVLAPTPVKEKQTILNALTRLNAGGSTAGGQGIKLAYQLAEANFSKDAVNRIILATDGDFNVGIRNSDELKGFVSRKRAQGVFLSVLGFGQGNYNDQLMQALAQNGNGIAAYIDSVREAQKVLIDEATSTLFPIAKDVKIQVEFNPNRVSEYRLIGYESRRLNREDFNNDKVDAGDIGAGHTVTAMYEITPKLADVNASVDPLRYEDNARRSKEQKLISDSINNEYGFLKIRYKLPTEEKSKLIVQVISSDEPSSGNVDKEAEFATAVAGFAQLLKGGKYLNNYTYDDVINSALKSRGDDIFGYRSEFIQLVRSAKTAAAIK